MENLKNDNTLQRIIFVSIAVLAMNFTAYAQAQESDSDVSREERREAFAECAEAAGLELPEAGQRPQAPDESKREQIDACMKEKGFEPPAHHMRGEKRQRRGAAGVK